jgi:hypothetical protein
VKLFNKCNVYRYFIYLPTLNTIYFLTYLLTYLLTMAWQCICSLWNFRQIQRCRKLGYGAGKLLTMSTLEQVKCSYSGSTPINISIFYMLTQFTYQSLKMISIQLQHYFVWVCGTVWMRLPCMANVHEVYTSTLYLIFCLDNISIYIRYIY